MQKLKFILFFLLLFSFSGISAQQNVPKGTKIFKDLAYVNDGHALQNLDLYIPQNKVAEPLPLVIWIHGGGWQKGSKNIIQRHAFILKAGFAFASVDYRLTNEATFPAQINDCKAAIRYLRRNARTFGLDPKRFGVWGGSAGGHLVALLGTSNGEKELEGKQGYLNVSSDVQAVCDWYGPTDLGNMVEHARLRNMPEERLKNNAVYKLLGGIRKEHLEIAKNASPVNYVDPSDPPFLIMHGDQDQVVPLSESQNLHKLLQKSNVESELIIVPGAKHGFFRDADLHQNVVSFFKKHLISEDSNEKISLVKATSKTKRFIGNWALTMPDGSTGWMCLKPDGKSVKGELWMVGAPKALTDVNIKGTKLHFTHQRAIGKPDYVGGPPTGKKIPLKHIASLQQDKIKLVVEQPSKNGTTEKVSFEGKRIPPIPKKPDLNNVKYGDPIELFNGKNLDDWRLTNAAQTNCWKAVDGELFNDTPKTTFDPFAKYGNLRTDKEFTNFNLQIDFNVPKGGNSGIYLKGMYEVQVVDHDSRMQGLHGVGAVFNRILPGGNYGKEGGEWQHYDITLIDRHITVVLNGTKIIDNEAIEGCTNGALTADETLPGPIYLQGDHTSVRYRNIVIRPVVEK